MITISKQSTLIRPLLGIIFAPQTQSLSSQITGMVTSHINMGHPINKGDIIIQLDEQEAKMQLNLAKAKMEVAKIHVQQKQLAFGRLHKIYKQKP